jgi:hypothetical protein
VHFPDPEIPSSHVPIPEQTLLVLAEIPGHALSQEEPKYPGRHVEQLLEALNEFVQIQDPVSVLQTPFPEQCSSASQSNQNEQEIRA